MTPEQQKARDLIRMAVSGQTEHPVELVTSTHTDSAGAPPMAQHQHPHEHEPSQEEIYEGALKGAFAQQITSLTTELAQATTALVLARRDNQRLLQIAESLQAELAVARDSNAFVSEGSAGS